MTYYDIMQRNIALARQEAETLADAEALNDRVISYNDDIDYDRLTPAQIAEFEADYAEFWHTADTLLSADIAERIIDKWSWALY